MLNHPPEECDILPPFKIKKSRSMQEFYAYFNVSLLVYLNCYELLTSPCGMFNFGVTGPIALLSKQIVTFSLSLVVIHYFEKPLETMVFLSSEAVKMVDHHEMSL